MYPLLGCRGNRSGGGGALCLWGGAQGASGSGSALSWKFMGKKWVLPSEVHPPIEPQQWASLHFASVSLVVIRARLRCCLQMLVVSAEWESRVLGSGPRGMPGPAGHPQWHTQPSQGACALPRVGAVSQYLLSSFLPSPSPLLRHGSQNIPFGLSVAA